MHNIGWRAPATTRCRRARFYSSVKLASNASQCVSNAVAQPRGLGRGAKHLRSPALRLSRAPTMHNSATVAHSTQQYYMQHWAALLAWPAPPWCGLRSKTSFACIGLPARPTTDPKRPSFLCTARNQRGPCIAPSRYQSVVCPPPHGRCVVHWTEHAPRPFNTKAATHC